MRWILSSRRAHSSAPASTWSWQTTRPPWPAAHPDVADRIIGNFSGGLADGDDNVRLVDAWGNPADEVHYYDGGSWPTLADGGGSSLELLDPDADNSVAEAWTASDEAARSTWQTYSYRGTAQRPSGATYPQNFNEFSFGLLRAGELLIDDIHVVEDPDGAALDFIQNSTFTGGFDRWRPVGNQHGEIVPDPDDPTNDVFHLVATGGEEHLQNHVETTLKNAGTFERIVRGQEYEISFRAKWLGGSPQLNTRLFFNYLPRTTILATPLQGGTPGTVNSRGQQNLGPTFAALQHFPSSPAAGEDVTVSVRGSDVDGVAGVTLWYAVNEAAHSSRSR